MRRYCGARQAILVLGLLSCLMVYDNLRALQVQTQAQAQARAQAQAQAEDVQRHCQTIGAQTLAQLAARPSVSLGNMSADTGVFTHRRHGCGVIMVLGNAPPDAGPGLEEALNRISTMTDKHLRAMAALRYAQHRHGVKGVAWTMSKVCPCGVRFGYIADRRTLDVLQRHRPELVRRVRGIFDLVIGLDPGPPFPPHPDPVHEVPPGANVTAKRLKNEFFATMIQFLIRAWASSPFELTAMIEADVTPPCPSGLLNAFDTLVKPENNATHREGPLDIILGTASTLYHNTSGGRRGYRFLDELAQGNPPTIEALLGKRQGWYFENCGQRKCSAVCANHSARSKEPAFECIAMPNAGFMLFNSSSPAVAAFWELTYDAFYRHVKAHVAQPMNIYHPGQSGTQYAMREALFVASTQRTVPLRHGRLSQARLCRSPDCKISCEETKKRPGCWIMHTHKDCTIGITSLNVHNNWKNLQRQVKTFSRTLNVPRTICVNINSTDGLVECPVIDGGGPDFYRTSSSSPSLTQRLRNRRLTLNANWI
jgi:hypothetical protein